MPKFLDFVSRDYLSGLVVPSIHAFSGNIESRIKMFQMALENGQQILFVDENLLLNDQTGIDLIRKIYALER
jgi:hypothetical protein